MPTMFTWEPVVECSVAQDYSESHAIVQVINSVNTGTEAISASHEPMHMVIVS